MKRTTTRGNKRIDHASAEVLCLLAPADRDQESEPQEVTWLFHDAAGFLLLGFGGPSSRWRYAVKHGFIGGAGSKRISWSRAHRLARNAGVSGRVYRTYFGRLRPR